MCVGNILPFTQCLSLFKEKKSHYYNELSLWLVFLFCHLFYFHPHSPDQGYINSFLSLLLHLFIGNITSTVDMRLPVGFQYVSLIFSFIFPPIHVFYVLPLFPPFGSLFSFTHKFSWHFCCFIVIAFHFSSFPL